MKLAVLSEYDVDEAVVRTLVEAILGETTDVARFPVRPGGWLHVKNLVAPVLRHLHGTGADALVVVADSDDTPVVRDESEGEDHFRRRSRLHLIETTIADTQRTLRPRSVRGPVKTAAGLAIPCIEAWCLCGRDPHVTGAAWIQALGGGRRPFDRNELKRRLYGNDRAPSEVRRSRAVEEATRLAADLGALAQRFPIGFGSLLTSVKAWREAR